MHFKEHGRYTIIVNIAVVDGGLKCYVMLENSPKSSYIGILIEWYPHLLYTINGLYIKFEEKKHDVWTCFVKHITTHYHYKYIIRISLGRNISLFFILKCRFLREEKQ